MIDKKVTRGGDVRYRVRLRRPDGSEYLRTFRTKREAVQFEASERAAKAQGAWVDPAAGRIKFGTWADEWLATASHTWRARTIERHRMAIDTHWRPRFGPRPLNSISARDVQAAINDLAGRYQAGSVRTYYGTLRSCLQFAVERELIQRSPCRAIKLPADTGEEKQVVSIDELHRLADAVGPDWRAFIYLAGVLGLRFGEVAGLRRRDVDLERAEVSVRQTLTEVAGRVTIGPPKSRASVRTVAAPTPLVAELVSYCERRSIESPDALLFVNRAGQPLRRGDFRAAVFLPALRRTGLEGLTFHGLRHSAATQWVASGIDIRTVQAWLGHANPQLVLRLYAHASSSAGRQAAEVLAGKFWDSP